MLRSDAIPLDIRSNMVGLALNNRLIHKYSLGVAPSSSILSVRHRTQEQDQWCWAACAEMVTEFLTEDDVSQCHLAAFLHEQENCCEKGDSIECNLPSPVSSIERVFSHLSVSSQFIDGSVELDEIKSEIAQGRPVEIGVRWSSGFGGHVYLLVGWEDVDGRVMVHLFDPWPTGDTGKVSLEDLQQAFGRGEWLWTWIGLRRE